MNITAPWMIKEECSYKHYSHPNPIQTTITFFNNRSNLTVTNLDNELAGGRNQEWKTITNQIGQNIEPKKPQLNGENMGELDYVKNINRLSCPIVLDPEHSTFDDVALHAYLRQRLSTSTIEK
jgi:hypothetical protein